MSDRKVWSRKRSKALDGQNISGSEAKRSKGYFEESTRSIRVSASDKAKAIPAQNVKPLTPQDLFVLTLLSTAAAQQEDLFDCLVSLNKRTQAKTERLHMACKDAASAFKSQESHRTQNILRAATAVARAVQAALESVSVSSCNTHVIQGKDVPASLMQETNLFTQNLYESAPADFWESVMDDIEAIKATASVVLVKYATNKANSANKS